MCKDRLISALSAAVPTTDCLGSGRWCVDVTTTHRLTIERDAVVDLLLTDSCSGAEGSVDIVVSPWARLRIVEVVSREGAKNQLNIKLEEGAECRMTQVLTASCDSRVVASLDGRGARFELGGSFILTDDERGSVVVDVKHNVADCSSRTMFKGVASGSAVGKFSGLVYVAPDAQRTDSEQLSRNITLGSARIETLPQLEIYADDVKCSHGATVGQMDDEAVLYMRQRGLSLATAKRLQIEGFVSDVVLHSAIEECREVLLETLEHKLEKL